VADAADTLALDMRTLEPVASLPGYNPLGNGVYSAAMIFDNGIVLDHGYEEGFEVFVVPEPAGAAFLVVAFAALQRRRRKAAAPTPPPASSGFPGWS
jgi:uncharacterized protein (TIGR03382 family)